MKQFFLVVFCFVALLSITLLSGCTSQDTFIINQTKLNKLFDVNIVGEEGLIPFINFDGNALEVQTGFDFNKDTNTLRVENFDGNGYFLTDISDIHCPDNMVLFGDGICREPISSTTYYPFQATISGGTITDNNIMYAWYYDDLNLTADEGIGANPLDLNILFTGVSDFDELILREYYLGSSSHFIQVQIWDWSDNEWEDYFEFVGQSGYTILSIPVFDASEHISIDGNVLFRLHHVQNGISSHKLYIDFAWLIDGEIIGGSTNLDGYARYNFSLNNFNGLGNFITDGNIEANKIKAGNIDRNANYAIDVIGTYATDIINSESGFRINLVPAIPTTDFNSSSLSLVAGGTNLDASARYHYYITYYTNVGETNISNNERYIDTTATDRKVLVQLPISTDSRVVGRNIWRSVGGGGAYNNYLLATIADNTTTTYLDDIPDSSLSGGTIYFRDNTTAKFTEGSTGVTFLTAGTNNTRFGIRAGSDTATGGRNSFFGALNGGYITTGSDNAGFGNGVFYTSNPNGTTCVGQYCMGAQNSATTISQAVGVGYGALFGAYNATARNVSGTVAVGYSAGGAGWSQSSVYVGAKSGQYVSGAGSNYNSCVGDSCLKGVSSYNASAMNSCVGWWCLNKVYSGAYMISLGARSGAYDENGIGKLYINSYNRYDLTGDRNGSIIYGEQTSTGSGIGQKLFVNADLYLRYDNRSLFFGLSDDASIYYDGTDLNINPKSVGSGKVNIQGDLRVDGNIYGGSPVKFGNGINAFDNDINGKRFCFNDGTCQTTASTGGGSQTPWTSDIEAGGYDLLNPTEIVFGNVLVTDSGSYFVGGDYQQKGNYNGKPYYQDSTGLYVYWNETESKWYLSGGLDDAPLQYFVSDTGDLEGSYTGGGPDWSAYTCSIILANIIQDAQGFNRNNTPYRFIDFFAGTANNDLSFLTPGDSSITFYTNNGVNPDLKVSYSGIKFHDAYTFPTSDGTANYFLQTDGAGTVSWALASVDWSSIGGTQSDVSLSGFNNDLTTDNINEGSTNLYYSDGKVDSWLTAKGGVSDTYDDGVDTVITFTNGIATGISTSYDSRLMKNIIYQSNANNALYLVPVTFKWNDLGLKQFKDKNLLDSMKDRVLTGFVAQDVNRFYPSCIVSEDLNLTGKVEKYYQYNRNCVQALQSIALIEKDLEVNSLNSLVVNLTAKVSAIEKDVNLIKASEVIK